jgi:hypothetical protein
MSLQDRVNAALDARLDADKARGLADALLAAVIGEAERARADGTPIREMSSDQRIGSIRLDGADLPAAPAIDKIDELASWLAEHFPELVTATIRVPVEKLAEALAALGYAGIDGPAVSASVAPRDLGEVLAWLARECVVQADPQISRAWNVLHKDGDGHLTPVPGTTARPPTPTWKVCLDKNRKRDALAVAAVEAEEILAELDAGPSLGEALTAAILNDLENPPPPPDETSPVTPWQTHSGDDDFPPEVETLAAKLERGMRAGDPEAAAAHAILIQGGYSTPEIEAERMAADRARWRPAPEERLPIGRPEDIRDGLTPEEAKRRDDEQTIDWLNYQDRVAAAAADTSTRPGGGIVGPMVDRFNALSRGVDAALAKREEYRTQTNPELAELLRERHLPVGGSKDERIMRLLQSDGLVLPKPGASD